MALLPPLFSETRTAGPLFLINTGPPKSTCNKKRLLELTYFFHVQDKFQKVIFSCL